MDDVTRAYYEGRFNVAFLTAKGDAFQTLFEQLMGRAHPGDFIPCRPWGNTGDNKNDGYLISERTLFQVYAPNEMRAAEAVAKIGEDFKGALPYWRQYFDKWVFVHNAHDGLSPHIVAKLLELERDNAPLKLSHWSLEELRQRLRRIPLDGLQSLFGFAPTGQSDRRPPSILPFVRVRDAGICVVEEDLAAFSPSLREFEEGLVHRPALADQVQAALSKSRFALVLGKGASGKTTLALLLAFGKPYGPERSYYLDLAEEEGDSEAIETYRAAMLDISRQHGRDTLVIVDNIHLAEALASKLYVAWLDDDKPVQLLLQGRFTQRGADRRGRPPPLENLKRCALVLEVTPNDLAGVLKRLICRTYSSRDVPKIPNAVLNQWVKVFGGELIAFCSAARRKLLQIVRGQYNLTEADAADYILEEYLEHENLRRRINSKEVENLLAIAACADWELGVPAESLLHPSLSALDVSAQRGLVWRSTHGRFGQFDRYRLCHPGMGKLLWAAARPGKSRLDFACELGQRAPYFGCLLANRLFRVEGDQEAGKRILVSAISRADSFEHIIEHGIVGLRVKCQLLTEFGVLSKANLDLRLAASRNLAQAALATPLDHLASFLRYAQINLVRVWLTLSEELAQEVNSQALVQIAFTTPLYQLVTFLRFLGQNTRLKPVQDTIVKALAEDAALPANESRLIRAARGTSFDYLWGFVRYIREKPQLKSLADAIEEDLVCSVVLNSRRRSKRFDAPSSSFDRHRSYWDEDSSDGEYWDGEED